MLRKTLEFAIFAGFACLVSLQGMAQPAGTFSATGSMVTPRAGHTATLLLNGKVLITGGYGGPEDDGVPVPLANAELYDPLGGTFTPTGSMTVGRISPRTILLPDGRVFIASAGDLSAEIYDPSAGVFLPTGRMAATAYPWSQAITLLPNGRVFIAGYPTAQLFDPVTGTFAATRPYASPAPAILQSATLLADGRVLLTGAVNICYEPLCADPGTAWTEIYQPAGDVFTPVGGMKGHNDVYTSTLLTSGKVLFAGLTPANSTAAELFDPSDGTFTLIGSALANHGYGAATLLPDGPVLISGGVQAVSELYDQASATFSPAGYAITARSSHTSTLLSDGTILIAGGYRIPDNSFTSSAELYRPAAPVSPPLLFSVTRSGQTQVAIWHSSTGQLVSPEFPAVAGETLSMYTTGLVDGGVISPQVAIGGRPAEIQFFGNAPGYPGFNQVNARMPAGIAPGLSVPVRLRYLGRPSNEVTIAVQ
jgi:Galactose oxidase, central domain